jgi:hypothetical protein
MENAVPHSQVAPAMLQEEELHLALMNLQNYAPVPGQSSDQVSNQEVKMEVPTDVEKMAVESMQFPAILSQLSDPLAMQLQQQQLQQLQIQQLQQQQIRQQLLQQQQLQQQQHPLYTTQTVPPTQVPINNDGIDMSIPSNTDALKPAVVPPPELQQVVYAIAPPLYPFPSMFSSFMYPMMLPDSGFSMGFSPGSPGSYQGSIPMKVKRSPSGKDSARKKQTRKTLWIPLIGTFFGGLF